MKKFVNIIIVVLVIWCLTLSIAMSNVFKANKAPKLVVEEHRVSGFTTDLTKAAAKAHSSIVTVQTSKSSGSGILVKQVDNTIYVATSYHLVANEEYILQVVFDNFTNLQAELVNYDAIKDVAILKIETDFSIKPIEFGDSDVLEKGEIVLSIGSPHGLDYNGTISFGVVSDNNRIMPIKYEGQTYYNNMVQTDVNLVDGGSGGALVNMDGELVAINTGTLVDNEDTAMTFSLTANELKYISDSIIKNGEVKRHELGLKLYPIVEMPNYQKTALGFTLDQVSGMYVNAVAYNSLAEKLGIERGDAILMINESKLNIYKDYFEVIYGDKAITNIQVLRKGEIINLGVEIND